MMHKPAGPDPIRVVLFCGGRGSATIIHELLRRQQIHLTLVVNAYDDGLSTGALRSYIHRMLGPSDFRKNLTYLLDPCSESQYALKQVLEMRFSASNPALEVSALQDWVMTGQINMFAEPQRRLFSGLEAPVCQQLRGYLSQFLAYAGRDPGSFDFRDCSVGNLLFAGAYLEHDCDFNQAAQIISELVGSRARLVNVSRGENRILAGLKEDGEWLFSEACVVGRQSPVRILDVVLLDELPEPGEWHNLSGSADEKLAFLRKRERIPDLSPEAGEAIARADIIVYGPGTQHSSLFPSYKIASQALLQAKAPIKAMIMNLGQDHDIQSLSAHDLADRFFCYMGDPENRQGVATHILLDRECTLDTMGMSGQAWYRACEVIADDYARTGTREVHNGYAVVEKVLALYEARTSADTAPGQTATLFLDLHNRESALPELYDELAEMPRSPLFTGWDLLINRMRPPVFDGSAGITVQEAHFPGSFPEVACFREWFEHGTSDILIVLTGDGKYHFRDVVPALHLLSHTGYGAVFGTRNQSRTQFRHSLRAAYGEHKLLAVCSLLGSFLLSGLFALRFGMIFSDPLTGFRIYRRSKILRCVRNHVPSKIRTPAGLAAWLLKHQVEIAELPVNYRTFAGFSDPGWRIRRALLNLRSLLAGVSG